MEIARVIAECKRCGREFVTLPNDGIDHYSPRAAYIAGLVGPRQECGGEVSRKDGPAPEESLITDRGR